MFWYAFLVVIGFVLLSYGGDRVCCGASGIAVRLGVSKFVVGMTIVAISTSAPEIFTSLMATFDGHSEVVAGNVIGSNLVNIGIAGGLVAVIKPFSVSSRVIKVEMPFLLLITCMFFVLGMLSYISKMEGLILCVLGMLYLTYICKSDQYLKTEKEEMLIDHCPSLSKSFTLFSIGLFLLLIGAQIVIQYSLVIAKMLGWSDSWVGFTIIAIGTSFPEVATSLVAAIRGYGEICTGNIIGSNIFNILFALGTSACIHPLSLSSPLCSFGMLSLVFLTAVMWRFFTTRREISRFEGLILFTIYAAILIKMFYIHVGCTAVN